MKTNALHLHQCIQSVLLFVPLCGYKSLPGAMFFDLGEKKMPLKYL